MRSATCLCLGLIASVVACAPVPPGTPVAMRPESYDCGGGRSLDVRPGSTPDSVAVTTGDDSLRETSP